MSESKMKAFAEMLLKWRPVMIRAYASALSLFAEYVRDRGYTGIRPKLIETTAEGISHPQRQLLETVFQCNVANWYTSREFGTIGFQCPVGGLHIAETRYVEIIAADKPAPPGTLGEVVITSTHQFTMPFIRYKIGDMAISDDTPCSCRRGLRHLAEIVGRLQDFLVTADGYFVHGGYFPHTFRAWPEIARYQVYQPDQSHIEVFLVCRHKDNVSWLDAVSHELQQRFGAAMHIAVHVVDEIKLNPAGKHRFIISEVKPDFIK